MKTFILILSFFLSGLFADDMSIVKDIAILKTVDKNITIANIKSYDALFQTADENATLHDENSTYWVRVTLDKELKSDMYVISYGLADFDLDSFTPVQGMYKFDFHGTHHFSFSYKKGRDASVYYVRLLPLTKGYPTYLGVVSAKNFYKRIDGMALYLLIAGLVLGLILMTAIYNGALYYFNRQKSFLYYALMQVFMVGVLFYHTGVPYALSKVAFLHPNIYEYFSLFTAFFAVLFARNFLETKRYLPSYDKVLQLFLLLIVLDMLYYPMPVIGHYGLYSFTTAYFLVVGFLRMRQGYKPARLFLIGWMAMVGAIMMLEYFDKHISYFDPMLLGSTIEAVMLAIALAYKVRLIQHEKERQKELMIHQSKLASMGEMIGNIAHQWRQPLTHLSYIFMNIEEIDDKKQRQAKVAEGTKQLEFMSQTIDDFRDFYAPDRKKEYFSIAHESEQVLKLIYFKAIDIQLDLKEDVKILNYKNAYKQVLINLISNAKEALIENHIQNPVIRIVIDKNKISVSDNAGGIKEENLKKIFEPYFTTKQKSSGIGLYMSKILVEKNMQGTLRVGNTKEGAVFSIEL